MHAVIATFEAPGGAEAFIRALHEVFGVARVTGDRRIGGQGEAYDGHRLVVAWVPRRLADDIGGWAERCGGVLHLAPPTAAPPDPSREPQVRHDGAHS